MTTQFNDKTNRRGIEWTDLTLNAVGGCHHACRWSMPDGTVAICYAEELAVNGVARSAYPNGFAAHYWRPNVLRQLSAGREPLLIFVDSMSDLFASNVPAEHVRAVLAAMRRGPHHAYQSLTKAAPIILKYASELPRNLWVGVSSPPDWFMGKRLTRDQQEAMLRRAVEVLREVKEKTGNLVWLSAEPVSWDLTTVLDSGHGLDWIVVGAASAGQRYFQPDKEHIRKLVNLMDATKTPIFYKGNLRPTFAGDGLGTVELNRWREDFPTAYRDGTPIPAVARRQQKCEEHGWARNEQPTPAGRRPLTLF
jgi:protein gp37